MGVRTVLVTGGSCTGKSTVCRELRRRGVAVVDGDRELAYQGDPITGAPVDSTPVRPSHWNHLWDVSRTRALASGAQDAVTFFCGDARNLDEVLSLFDRVVVLEIDPTTLRLRLDTRPSDEFGARPDERDLVLRLHDSRERWPSRAITVDATRPVDQVVDEIIALV